MEVGERIGGAGGGGGWTMESAQEASPVVSGRVLTPSFGSVRFGLIRSSSLRFNSTWFGWVRCVRFTPNRFDRFTPIRFDRTDFGSVRFASVGLGTFRFD